MNLLAKTAEFERLCYQLVKRAQSRGWKIDPDTGKMVDTTSIPDASLSAPTPRYSVPAAKQKAPTMTVDPNQSKMMSEPNMSNPPAKSTPLQPGAHPGAPAAHPAPARSAPAASAKPTKAPAAFLTQYMKEQKEKETPTALERANTPSTFDADAAAARQVARAKNPANR